MRSVRHEGGPIVLEYEDLHPETLFEPGHEIYDWAEQLRAMLQAETVATAPGPGSGLSLAKYTRPRTGALKAGIRAILHRTGPESYEIILGSSVEYTMYVHRGTAYERGGYIYSDLGWANREFVDALYGTHIVRTGSGKSGKWEVPVLPIARGFFMRLPPGISRIYHLRVRGQRANPFLIRGYNRTHLFHEALPSLSDINERIEGIVGPHG